MGYTTQGIRNIALVGSAGGGKTLLLEGLLLQAGAIRSKGSLERGATVSDFDPQAPHSPPDAGKGRVIFDENQVAR